MDISEKSSTQPSRFAMLDNYRMDMPKILPLREMYQARPITMHQTYQTTPPVKFPPVIRAAYAQIWSGKYNRIIIKAPRGGGKSKLLGTVGFDLWYIRDRSVVTMGGSLVQAEIVYGYFRDFCSIDSSIATHVAGTITMDETKSVAGNKFSCVTASEKSVRGKHPDVLISDETCETDDGLIHSALPMVNDSANPLVVMASTFHKIYGIFQETWDNAEQRGYLRIQWDIFDVCLPFAADYWENGILQDGTKVKDIAGVEKLKKYANGRTGHAEGWVPIANVVQAWREKPTEDWFEVEYLGSRPSAAGLVLKPEDVDRALFDSRKEKCYNFIIGSTVVLGIDWGFSSMTSVTEFMGYKDGVVVQLDCRNYHQTPSDDIIKAIVEKVRLHRIRFIYADSAGKFENIALQNELVRQKLPCKVVEVVFSKEKFGTPGVDGSIGMLGNLRAHFEQGKIKIPKEVQRVDEKGVPVWVSNAEAYWQYKRYRYQEGTDKPVKKNDHIPDSTMCALQHFMLGQLVRSLPNPVAPVNKETVRPITAGLLKKQF